MTDHAQGAEPSRTGAEAAPTRAETEATTGSNESDDPSDRIEARLSAVERAVTGSDARPADAAVGAEATAERERLESRLDDLEERVAELEAATQAVRGYAGAVRAVNREVERRADLALARATEAGRGGGRGKGRDDVDGGATDGQRLDSGRPGPHSRGDESVSASGDESAVPSESALDAALPDDRPTSGPRTGNGERDEDDGDGDDGAWATDALDRLRESL